ncbi:MAG: peptidylprolyl isomerase [Gammaproteobacteria bacterium]
MLEILDAYDRKAGKPGTEYKARHILAKTPEEAEEFIHELDKDGDFSILAKDQSADTSASEGGDIGWFSAAQMVQPFSDAFTRLNKGSYTEEPVQCPMDLTQLHSRPTRHVVGFPSTHCKVLQNPI